MLTNSPSIALNLLLFSTLLPGSTTKKTKLIISSYLSNLFNFCEAKRYFPKTLIYSRRTVKKIKLINFLLKVTYRMSIKPKTIFSQHWYIPGGTAKKIKLIDCILKLLYWISVWPKDIISQYWFIRNVSSETFPYLAFYKTYWKLSKIVSN